MAVQQFLLFIVLAFFLMFVFELYRVKNRVHCRFTRRDKTIGHKWAKAKNNERIEFEGGWYYVVMKRIRLDSAFFGLLLARVLDFKYDKSNPIDPETGSNDWETPEARKNLNKREDIEAYNVGSKAAMGKTKVGLMSGGWMPIILILGIVIIGYFVFQMRGQIDAVGQALNVLQEMMMKKGF